MKRIAPEHIVAVTLVLILSVFAIWSDMSQPAHDDHPSFESELDAAMVPTPGVYGSPVQDLRAEYAAAYHRARVEKLKQVDHCEACGIKSSLETHHVISVDRIFHERLNPELVGDVNNLIVLHRGTDGGCHRKYGHPDGWDKSNPNVRKDAAAAYAARRGRR